MTEWWGKSQERRCVLREAKISEPSKEKGAGTASKAVKMLRKVRIEKSLLDLAI